MGAMNDQYYWITINRTLSKWIESCTTVEQIHNVIMFTMRPELYQKHPQRNTLIQLTDIAKMKGKMIITGRAIDYLNSIQ